MRKKFKPRLLFLRFGSVDIKYLPQTQESNAFVYQLHILDSYTIHLFENGEGKVFNQFIIHIKLFWQSEGRAQLEL